ncbi:hypothetical protein ACFQH6_12555 [Halobacteriaceae archaeon GCM10025711]
MPSPALPVVVVESGLLESVANLVALAGMVVLVLIIVAMGGIAYRSMTGDGIQWPGDADEAADEDEVSRGRQDDEWKYY